MPGENSGRDLARIVAEEHPLIRVLLTTGMEPNKAAEPSEEDEFPVLAKPYSAEDLAHAIRAILGAEK
jgi:DNA-binding NtrC family response regulator